jgi:predicted helicase
MDYPRRELIDHVASKDNFELVASRQIGSNEWRHAFVGSGPANDCLISDESSEANQVFPLWRYKADNARSENLSEAFRDFIDQHYPDIHCAPEEIFGYIYGVLYAPTYRSRYAEFLRIDFPRIPFPEKHQDFDALSKLGWQLVQAHLLKHVPDVGLGKYHGRGDHEVEDVRYSEEQQAISIKKKEPVGGATDQYFKPVPKDVWEFHIGGYQVLEKYLKSRKGRKLTLDEINHIAQVADSLAFTIRQMAEIDKAYKRAFPHVDN